MGPLPVDPDKAGAVGVVGGTALKRLGLWDKNPASGECPDQWDPKGSGLAAGLKRPTPPCSRGAARLALKRSGHRGFRGASPDPPLRPPLRC